MTDLPVHRWQPGTTRCHRPKCDRKATHRVVLVAGPEALIEGAWDFCEPCAKGVELALDGRYTKGGDTGVS